jgi:hypothetical protein
MHMQHAACTTAVAEILVLQLSSVLRLQMAALFCTPERPLPKMLTLLWAVIVRCHCRRCAAVPMSIDHKPNSREERTRIEDAGGVVVWAGTWRVGGVLAVSRAFGDRPLKRYVIPTPDIKDEVLTSEDDCLILASDGLWDVVSNQVGRARSSLCRSSAEREHPTSLSRGWFRRYLLKLCLC